MVRRFLKMIRGQRPKVSFRRRRGGLSRWSQRTECTEMRFGVGADIGESSWIGHACGLAGFGVRPAFALFEFHLVIVEQHINWDGRQHKRWRHASVRTFVCSAAL